MRLILLSGGAGKRLWPLSNNNRPKQFLPVLQHGDLRESMLQRVWRQLEEAGLAQHAIFSSSGSQKELILSQISTDIEIVEEPERRDTFPAIALAAAHLYSQGVDKNEIITVMPVDGYADHSFIEHIPRLATVLEDTGCDIALIGVKPNQPSEKYGYIVPGKNSASDHSYHEVECFTEKPDLMEAAQLIEKGALWNCGVFAFHLGYIIEILRKKGLPYHYQQLRDMYSTLPKSSFDIEVVEKTDKRAVITYNGTWKDLGTWDTLTEEMASNIIGKGHLCKNSTDSHIINELDLPVSVWKVPNIIVVSGPDGILVTDRNEATGIKHMVQQVEIPPRYDERLWGKQTILMHKVDPEGIETLTKRVIISAGRNISYQEHHLRKEVWTIVSGSGEVCLDGKFSPIHAGDTIIVEIGVRHAIRALKTDLELIEVQVGKEIGEMDTIRFTHDWDLAPSIQ
ncbi:Alginate biosynthesis protein AlgA [Paenibacillus sp. JJ-100]|uniref:sugar phosphate nucleotidyltransferase n=1 Tax=Paenibacillus sp. JJ-100 TaxID=2974896 RepID=UPI0022FF8B6F|nr:sugar phosphate nucleotidyltransferase [Paenibacillus sp. JJ-100]CAI6084581.1 Alginate biosynthesis protein AlgA [Paenibacillus sp. JJ-100]